MSLKLTDLVVLDFRGAGEGTQSLAHFRQRLYLMPYHAAHQTGSLIDCSMFFCCCCCLGFNDIHMHEGYLSYLPLALSSCVINKLSNQAWRCRSAVLALGDRRGKIRSSKSCQDQEFTYILSSWSARLYEEGRPEHAGRASAL